MLELNFIPEQKQAVKLELDYIYWALEAIVLLVLLIIGGATIGHRVNYYNNLKEQKSREVKQNEALIRKIKKLTADRKNLQRKKNIIDQLDTNRQKWVKIFDTLLDLMPDQVWLTGFAGTNTSIRITGVAITILYLNDFMKALQSSNMFSSVTLGKITSGRSRAINQPIYKFNLTLTVNPNNINGDKK